MAPINNVSTRRLARWQVCLALVAALSVPLLQGCASSKKKSAEANRAQASQESFEAAANQRPNARTLHSLAKILVSQGRDRDAIHLLTRIIQEYPSYLPAYNEMAGVYLRSDRLGDATAVLSAGLQQSPRDPILHNNIGMCWFLREDYEKALESFSHAVDAVPDNASYRANQAAALGMLGRYTESADSYRGVIDSDSVERNLKVFSKARRDARAKEQEEQSKAVVSPPDGAAPVAGRAAAAD